MTLNCGMIAPVAVRCCYFDTCRQGETSAGIFRYTDAMSWQESVLRHISTAKRPLIAVLGTTASGKTALSIRMARFIAQTAGQHPWNGAEVVNADSRQLYRHLDIGTAKITAQEMEGVPHHLLDLLDPREEVTISWYKEHAQKAIDDILSRGKVPLLAGGAMLYVSAVIDGLMPLPAADEELRVRLRAEYDRDGGVTAYARLKEADPESAATFHPNNRFSVIRALEILETTGQRPSEVKQKADVPYDVLPLCIRWPREKIVQRIDERTRLLLHGGWIEEVWRLLARGYTETDPGMKSHGYRDVCAAIRRIAAEKGVAIEGEPPAFLRELYDDPPLYDTIAQQTRQYAKRQMTWWNGRENVVWIDGESF